MIKIILISLFSVSFINPVFGQEVEKNIIPRSLLENFEEEIIHSAKVTESIAQNEPWIDVSCGHEESNGDELRISESPCDEFFGGSSYEGCNCDPCGAVRAYLIPYYTRAFGKTVGIEDDYQMLGGFLGVPNFCNSALGLIQGNILFIEKDIWAGSIGAGARFFDSRWWGANIFYDFRKDEYGSFHQIGAGCESFLRNGFDLRANVYFPLSNTKRGETIFFSYPEGDYQASAYESNIPMYAANGEIGKLLCLSSCYRINSYVAIGPYFLGFPDENAIGIRFRAAITYIDRIWLELFTTYDNVFGPLVQGQLTFSFPFQFLCGSFDSCGRRCCPNPPIIERFDAIPLHKCCNWTWNW